MDNSLLNIFLIVVSIVGTLSGLYVVTQTNVFRAAICLALSFICVSIVYFAINAEFLGAVQILVYVGAVSVLMAFSILLVKDLQTASSTTKGFSFFLSIFTSLLIFIVLSFVILNSDWSSEENIKDPLVKELLFEKYRENPIDQTITFANEETPANEVREGLFNNSIIPLGSLLSTRYFISLQLIGLIIVACVVGSITITKNTIENDEEGVKEII
ncbi:MAG: NADH-quinone oxidoreductase subunit J [Dehalococcoidia bacterium]|jgi:NADH:ubiquinone oxidoreductase subunit 6 (subunit J)|nr:NADH-quinone oxidoreductase subunit J [Dehalococcoidia bacterium]